MRLNAKWHRRMRAATHQYKIRSINMVQTLHTAKATHNDTQTQTNLKKKEADALWSGVFHLWQIATISFDNTKRSRKDSVHPFLIIYTYMKNRRYVQPFVVRHSEFLFQNLYHNTEKYWDRSDFNSTPRFFFVNRIFDSDQWPLIKKISVWTKSVIKWILMLFLFQNESIIIKYLIIIWISIFLPVCVVHCTVSSTVHKTKWRRNG